MTVCEICAGSGYTCHTHHGTPMKVLCGCCLGTGLLCLGHESRRRYTELREQARAKAVREGWYEVQWSGPAGQAKKVYVPCADERRERASA